MTQYFRLYSCLFQTTVHSLAPGERRLSRRDAENPAERGAASEWLRWRDRRLENEDPMSLTPLLSLSLSLTRAIRNLALLALLIE